MIERVIEYSIRNRFLVMFVAAAITVWAIYAVLTTPVDAIPDLSENQVIVFTDWMLYDAYQRRADTIWFFVILFVFPVGPWIYFFAVKLGDFGGGLHFGNLFARRVSLDELRYQAEHVPTLTSHLALAERLIELHQAIAAPVKPARVIAVALNTVDLSEAAARAAIERTEAQTGLPATDPVRFGSARLMDAIERHTDRYPADRSE